MPGWLVAYWSWVYANVMYIHFFGLTSTFLPYLSLTHFYMHAFARTLCLILISKFVILLLHLRKSRISLSFVQRVFTKKKIQYI